MEAAFSLRENPHLSHFITEAALKACKLEPVKGSQVAFAASPSTTMPPPVGEVALDTAFDPSGCLNVIESDTVVLHFIFTNTIVFAFVVVLPTFKGTSACC